MIRCKYCDKEGLKWKDISTTRSVEKWVLWDVDNHWEHKCGFKSLGNCKYCGAAIRWKEEFDVEKGNIYRPYRHSKDEEHTCKWKHIKHLPPKERPFNWR